MTEEFKILIQFLDKLTNEERLELYTRYCKHCGRKQPENVRGCQCWNDE